MIYWLFRCLLANLFRLWCLIATLLHPKRYQKSRPREANPDIKFDFKETWWWLYKYYFRQVEHAETPEIEAPFASAALDFTPPEEFTPETSARISAAGDILPSDYITPNTISHLLDDIEDFYFDAELVCANLESPVAPGQPFSAIPKNLFIPLRMNNSVEVFDAFYRNGKGIALFTTANNHAMDRGEAGLLETIDFLDSKGALHTGTSKGSDEEFLITERNHIKIAFISYTYSLNGKGAPQNAQVNRLRLNLPGADFSPLYAQISKAKAQHTDVVILALHWGLENESYPTQHFIDATRTLWEHGADVIIGNHAHGVQPVESYRCADPYSQIEKPRLAFYALGDFMSYHPAKNTRLGLLAKFALQKGTANGEAISFVSGVQFLPTYLYTRKTRDVSHDFRVLRLWGNATAPLNHRQKREILRLRKLQKKVIPHA
ncbi:MAG: CapA family protein [Oscillospiraceae bacterium]|jgi:poly-gamma-glutamate synthesis protein (capsule biosynthesis protein)|nr:CapA family protein [Oscillospiraceae bacterium]